MENGLTFFFDSYALIEIYEKNSKYEKYSHVKVATTFLQVYEVYYSLIRNGYSAEEIKDFYNFLQNFCIDLNFDWIPKASLFKQNHKSRNLSYADCLGYIIAEDLRIKFLTGDKEFQNLPNAEFVRKN